MKRYTVDDHLWPGQSCMTNKFGIRNQIQLDSVVNDFVTLRMDELFGKGVPANFDSAYLKSVHGFLFQDCYDWAWEFRECPMGRNMDYVLPEEISGCIDGFCGRFRREFLDAALPVDGVADVLACQWAELNRIHPFRDGNGRSQGVFFMQACRSIGYELDFQTGDLKNLRAARDAASEGREALLMGMLPRGLQPVPGFVRKPLEPVKKPSMLERLFRRNREMDRNDTYMDEGKEL